MDIEEKFLKHFIKVTQQASIATFSKIGNKNKKLALSSLNYLNHMISKIK